MSRLLPVAVLLLIATGCGPYSRSDARKSATTRACNWYDACGEIGSGGTYADRDECELEVGNGFNNLWDDPACEEIEGEDLEICLKAIDATQCGNAFDFLNTIFNKCSVETVCGPQ